MAFRIREGNFGIFGEARTISRSTGTAFKDRKSLVKTVKSLVPVPRFPPRFPISHFPFPDSETHTNMLPR